MYHEGELLTFHFHDLLDYKMQEDVDFSAARGTGSPKCYSLIVRLKVNDLHHPQIVVHFITEMTDKRFITYKERLEEAESLVSILTYIENKNKEEQSKNS